MIEACTTAPGSRRSSPGCSASDKRSMKRTNSSDYPQSQPAKPLQDTKRKLRNYKNLIFIFFYKYKNLIFIKFDKSKRTKKDKSFKDSRKEKRTLGDRRHHRGCLALPRAHDVSGDRSIFRCRRRTRFLGIFSRRCSGFLQGTAIIGLKSNKSIAQEA